MRHIMRRIFIQIALFLTPIFVFSQINSEIDRLIENLSWNSITYDHSYDTFIVNYQDSSVKNLIHIGLPAANKLLESIENPEKTVIIHILLTKIIEPDNNNDYLPIKYIYKDCNNLIGWHHIFNGLIWEWEDSNSISPQEIEKVKNYWSNRISGKIDTWENNIEDIFQEIVKSDSIKYPCYKVYQNNSAQVRLKDIMELFDYDFSADKFNEIFTILGNDSTISKYSDCHFVSYEPDGISFRFDIHNKLTTIFIYDNYQGEIPFGLKYTDKEKDVKRKIGNPDESWSVSEYKYVEYKKNRLYLGYDENKKIMQIAISRE